MTNQEKKEYLWQYRVCGEGIHRLEEEITSWEAKSQKMTAQLSNMPRGGTGDDKLQLCIEEIVRLQEELTRQRMQELQKRRNIEKAIREVPDGRLRLLLRYRYIDGMTFDQIAWCMNYSWRQIIRNHNKALTALTVKMA